MKEKQKLRDEIDWVSTLVPLGFVGLLFAVFVLWPEQSRGMLDLIRGKIGDEGGLYYAVLGTGILVCSLYIAFRNTGKLSSEIPRNRSILPFGGGR